LSEAQELSVLQKFVDTTKEAEALREQLQRLEELLDDSDDCVTTAINLLKLFSSDFSDDKFVERVIQGVETNATGEVFPRKPEFAANSERNQRDIVNVMTKIALKIAKILLPRDAEKGAGELLRRMTENSMFRRFAMPGVERYDDWAAHPIVGTIGKALEKLGKSDTQLRVQLLSLLHGYPNDWLYRRFDNVGRGPHMLVRSALGALSTRRACSNTKRLASQSMLPLKLLTQALLQ
jgi:hypothetical protein